VSAKFGFDRGHIETSSASNLIQGLSHLVSITRLYFGFECIEDCDSVCQQLLSFQSFRYFVYLHFDLSHNGITAIGARALVDLCLKLDCMTRLDLSLCYNRICDEGALYLSELKGHARLITLKLNLSGNYISEEGASHISQFCQSSSLKSLQIVFQGNNYIGDLGAKHLVQLNMSQSLTLIDLDFMFCNITDEGAQELAALHNTPSLTELQLVFPEGDISEEVLDTLRTPNHSGLKCLIYC
jgi:hypothetical protein